ncbi:ATP synthase F1 subunit gamma [Flavobacteriaceae bacterium 14752]|uniref:ATP synthase F1 subunit gamma n=1 Tax=Mesohalobacter salilacus TaxID=2491711 RepID=UPI000F62C7C3|nr:ATP synthase F1 subunit gamma [Flavobacteriaceae bacterium 14752]
MANLKELRSRISSVSSTMQITSAMKMVSAAKLSRAQDAIVSMRPYAEKLTQLLQDLSATVEDDLSTALTEERELQKVLIVAISSNRGLAGAFNTNIIKKVNQLKKETYTTQDVKVLTIGKKVNDILKKTYDIFEHHEEIFNDLSFHNSVQISKAIMNAFEDKAYDKVVLVYNRFKNAATQIVEAEDFLPLVADKTEDETPQQLDYIFEPEKGEIIRELMPKALNIQLYKALRDSFASEHGARMTAMHKATENATELRDGLKLTYNKARQAAITNEILEIVAGAEALND